MENNSNRWFYGITQKYYKDNKKDLIKFIIRVEDDDDVKKFKSVLKDSLFGKRKNEDDRDKVKEMDFYTMDYDNSNAKDMVAYHSVCYAKDDSRVNDLINKMKTNFTNIRIRKNKNTYSVSIGYEEVERGIWYGKDETLETNYPVCVLSYKRANDYGRTHKFLTKCKIKHYLYVEEQEYDEYKKWYDKSYCWLEKCENFSKQDMGSTPIRNHILDFWNAMGVGRVWLLDDNIKSYKRLYKGVKNEIYSVDIFKSIEEYIIQYDNVGIVSHNFNPFVNEGDMRACIVKNGKCYSSMLIPTNPRIRFRYKHQEDNLISMEYIEKGYCNLCFNNVLYDKNTSGMDKGGNREGIYKCKDEKRDGDGYKERYEYFVNIINELYNDEKLTLVDGIKTSSLVSRSKTMKSKEYHAEVNYKMLKKNSINDIKKISNEKYKSQLYFIPNSSNETSSEISSNDEEEKQIVVLDENVKYIIDAFYKKKEALKKEEQELIKRFPDYFT
jgi:hypothetical protein